jgi:hypothetical protein
MANLYEIGEISNLSLLKQAIDKNLKLLYLDIETSPYLSWHYGTKKLFINHAQIEETVKVTSAVAMWEYDLKPLVFEWEFKDGTGCDKKLLKDLDVYIKTIKMKMKLLK